MFILEENKEEKNENQFELSNIHVHVQQGTLTFIIGKIGSGKSTFIHSILGETKTQHGKLCLHANSISFCSQHPWIFNATLRENILFNLPLDEDRYAKVIKACALEDDMKQLPHGDQTEIGEHGINLSGGQQARISLARAVYRNSEIYLLDDIFSAVDSHVAHHILKYCIQGDLLKNKTILLVTHKLEYLEYANWIIALDQSQNQSRIRFQGTPEDMKNENFSIFTETDLLETYQTHSDEPQNSPPRTSSNDNSLEKEVSSDSFDSKLIVEEEHLQGSVKFSVFWNYIKEFGFFLLSTAGTYFIFSLFLLQFFLFFLPKCELYNIKLDFI